MMWIDDCIQSIVSIMEASSDQLKQRTYNVAAMSFTPDELATTIQKYKSNFKIVYEIDDRQKIGKNRIRLIKINFLFFFSFGTADSWPQVFDDHNARQHWNWNPKVDLDGLVQKMFNYLEQKQNLE